MNIECLKLYYTFRINYNPTLTFFGINSLFVDLYYSNFQHVIERASKHEAIWFIRGNVFLCLTMIQKSKNIKTLGNLLRPLSYKWESLVFRKAKTIIIYTDRCIQPRSSCLCLLTSYNLPWTDVNSKTTRDFRRTYQASFKMSMVLCKCNILPEIM
jgi:hypothetical protein